MDEQTTLTTIPSTSSSSSPCSNEISARAEDCAVQGAVEQWLENEAFPGFRVWQLAGIVLSVLLSIVIGLCCCIRFRVPRTKQEIEADYIRKRITRNFRRELSKISNMEMDEMDLQKALDRIRNEPEENASAPVAKECADVSQRNAQRCFRSRFSAVFDGMRVRFGQREHTGASSVMI
ncbi:uncharacterized protein LOC116852160 [Odontomachus brunneus]|uniref:uncharacterized protein LOC116852160 n=1 Tax=Odontomachus brunneus TaxID=486640 RepID=UPI0013F28823|nr:uncharacterized protein LOC116852160 [Odontomachus brunneus]XP_032688118.1 uncharacterized protein LOC116852160 [Odontomachus brunneus]